ncbi:hypothetical protein EK21DRAFT_111856 [Setomelanomma holmii]|uniref:Uncharacterized protein n=1 Tax=Setomelanomma holmii TaxID=210430 RepID=A0A9P4LNB9_9PLEO|nr:hypothetical protein EK21DRAFT_111856 [Setomelanomma holmii]
MLPNIPATLSIIVLLHTAALALTEEVIVFNIVAYTVEAASILSRWSTLSGYYVDNNAYAGASRFFISGTSPDGQLFEHTATIGSESPSQTLATKISPLTQN